MPELYVLNTNANRSIEKVVWGELRQNDHNNFVTSIAFTAGQAFDSSHTQ